MDPTLALGIFLVSAAILAAISIVEIAEYRRYKKATASVIAFGAGMNEQFKTIHDIVSRMGSDIVDMARVTNLLEQQNIFMNTILQTHSELLGLRLMPKAYKLHEELLNKE